MSFARRCRDHCVAHWWPLTVGALSVLAAAVVVWISNTVFPYHSLNHDEGVYLQQAAMLLEGQLFLEPPVEGVFRPWFFVDSASGLYPKYAPVPAAMFAPGVALGVPRLSLAVLGGAFVGLVVLLGAELFDRPVGLLAGVVVLASPLYLIEASVFLPYAPTTVLNLAFALSYLRADRTGSRRWAALSGAAVGLAFFSRPYTAVLFATPFIVHALWTLRTRERSVVLRQGTTAALGTAGVLLALGYNALVTGDPLVFPYEAFAPLDGLGFGYHEILDHGTDYTPELAWESNWRIWVAFATDWVAAGLVTVAVGVLGLGVTLARKRDPRRLALVGVVPAVMLGEMYFWGTYNMLGDLETPDDGLVANLGTYYHLDLLVPTAILAAVGLVWATRHGWRLLTDRLDRRPAAAVALAVLLVVTPIAGAAAAGPINDPMERNGEVTDYYEAAYEPFESTELDDSVVFIPSPYGPWQNHPFQALRNDPSFDGDTVYALDDRPFDVVDAYPDRDIYRYAYRGQWSPGVGPDVEPHLQSVEHARGDRVTVSASVGVPDSAILVSIRLASGTEQSRYTISDPDPNTTVRVSVADGEATLDGPAVDEPATVDVEDRDLLSTTLFVDYGRGSGFSYEVDIPVAQEDGTVRALTPDLEYCRVPHRCNGNAVYIPEQTPDDVFIETRLRGADG